MSGAHAETSLGALVRMANQIAVAFRTAPEAQAAASTAEHIRLFWSRKMRTDVLAHLDAGGAGLEPSTRRALELLRRETA